jgi:hypothetical protein
VLCVLLVLGVVALSRGVQPGARSPSGDGDIGAGPYARSVRDHPPAWLLVEDAGRTWWVSALDPVLETLGPGESADGTAVRRAIGVVRDDGTHVWPASRRRSRQPRGDIDREGVDPERTTASSAPTSR